MADYETLFPGRFMKKEALAHPKVIRIEKITVTVLEGEKGAENKVVLAYKAADGEGEIIWNKTNAALTAHALGERDYDKWIGHFITVYNNPNIDLAGKKVGGIRVFGSPEMKRAIKVEIKRPRRKKGEMYDLVPTDNKGNVKSASKTEPATAPPPEDSDAPPPEYWAATDAEQGVA